MTDRDTIAPFWERLPQFFAFPLQLTSLIYVGGLSLATILIEMMGGLSRFKALAFVVFLRFAYTVMESGARGRFNPESANFAEVDWSDKRPYKQIFVFFLYSMILLLLSVIFSRPLDVPPGLAASAAAQIASADKLPPRSTMPAASATDDASTSVGNNSDHDNDATSDADNEPVGTDDDKSADANDPASTRDASLGQVPDSSSNPAKTADDARRTNSSGLWARILADDPRRMTPMFYLLAILCALPLPASIMVIALEDSLWRALNPMNFFHFVGGMGRAYFILWGFFVLIFLGREGLMHLLPVSMSPLVRSPIESFFSMYLLLALYAMMGYALYQYHQQLGHDVHVDFDTHHERESGEPQSDDPLTRKVNAAVAAGNIGLAIGFLQDDLRYDQHNVPGNQRLYDLVLKQGEPDKIAKQAKQLMNALLANGDSTRALPIWRKIVELEPGFELPADQILPFATLMVKQRENNEAIALMKGFDRKFPAHADTPGVYLLSARIASDHMRRDDLAIKFLKVLLQRYPEWENVAQAKLLLTTLEQVKKTAN